MRNRLPTSRDMGHAASERFGETTEPPVDYKSNNLREIRQTVDVETY